MLELAWYSPIATQRICFHDFGHDHGIHAFKLTWYYLIFEFFCNRNKISLTIWQLWSSVTSSFKQQMFLAASAALWSSSNLWNSRIRLSGTSICADFKSQTDWRNSQRISAWTTTIPPTTAFIFNQRLNSFSHVIYARKQACVLR